MPEHSRFSWSSAVKRSQSLRTRFPRTFKNDRSTTWCTENRYCCTNHLSNHLLFSNFLFQRSIKLSFGTFELELVRYPFWPKSQGNMTAQRTPREQVSRFTSKMLASFTRTAAANRQLSKYEISEIIKWQHGPKACMMTMNMKLVNFSLRTRIVTSMRTHFERPIPHTSD